MRTTDPGPLWWGAALALWAGVSALLCRTPSISWTNTAIATSAPLLFGR